MLRASRIGNRADIQLFGRTVVESRGENPRLQARADHSDLEADDISKLYAQLEEITRRVNARIRQRSDPLSFVEYSLVSFIGGHLGCRATDLADAFQLNRSTTSRQVNALVELGLIEHCPAGAAGASRGQGLTLTERGRLFLARAVEPHRTSIAERVADWTPAEIAASLRSTSSKMA